ncbi:MAG: sigma-54-dependent Fis family transcriptional regulator [Chitinophagaceae bacterium]|nr:sigma-54-dependent Fis family transcriptional regulator [Chitinophagaceae bacterium]MBL0199380.1 sigma-54-dependent Fis family transcriptional regulator [Chitinophagaceae bacterium]
MKKILIIDDEEKLRSLLTRIIKLEGFTVTEAGSLKAGTKLLEKETFDIILCDVKLPDGNGVDFVKEIKPKYPSVEIILLTAYGNIADGVQAIRNGAFDYITKGDDNDKIIPLLNRAIEKVQLQNRVQQLEQQVGKQYSFENILGESTAITDAIAMAKKVAPTETHVLLLGETGTGKEVFAQAIHQAGSRKTKNFVALNCSTFSKDILESELFGHKQGAFTGAVKDQKGLIEEANGGTLFLDEIGEMPLELQAKLLRILETNEFIKIGDTKPTRSDFRLIAATNKDLQKESEEQRFRSDLFYRLNVFQIKLPSLRERVKDIETLAKHFVQQYAAKINKAALHMDAGFLQKLQQYKWPGNIRELKNIIERTVILSDGETLTASLLPFDMQQSVSSASGETLSAFSMASMEKLQILKVLNYTKGNKAETARLLEIGVTTLYRKLEEYKIQ